MHYGSELFDAFQSTPSVGRATECMWHYCPNCGISIHALRGEGDGYSLLVLDDLAAISIHALRGEGDVLIVRKVGATLKISIHALRGEGDDVDCAECSVCHISIHALRGEGDVALIIAVYDIGISIHALRGEGDDKMTPILLKADAFQSTPSVGRAT